MIVQKRYLQKWLLLLAFSLSSAGGWAQTDKVYTFETVKTLYAGLNRKLRRSKETRPFRHYRRYGIPHLHRHRPGSDGPYDDFLSLSGKLRIRGSTP